MPTPQDLQRLRALLAQLTAIGSVQRGELIRAEDWNSLVAAVTDVAQAVLSVEATPTVPPHEHLDQVGSGWLSQQLRDLVERGPLADPATQTRLLDLDQRLKRLTDRLDEMRGRVDEFRGRITDVVTRDLEREAAVTKVRRAVENVIDPRPDLLNLRQSLGSLQRDLGSVMEAASKMTIDGQIVDLGAVVNRVGQLEQFRERLRFANGELLDAASVENRLAAVENKFVTQGQLDDAIKNRPLEVSPEVLGGIEDRLGTNLRNQVNQSLEAFGAQIRTETNTRLGTVGDLVNSRLNDALPEVTRNITNTLNASIDAARKSAVEAAAANAAQAMDALNKSLRADLGRLIDNVGAGIAPAVKSELASQLAGQLEGLRADLANVSKKLNAVATQTARQEEVLNQHSVRLAALPQEQANLKNDLRTAMLGEIELRFSQANQSIDARLSDFEKAQAEQISTLTTDLRKLATDTARKIATETALAQTRELRTQLLAEMRAVAREEIAVSVRDQVKTAVAAEVKEQFTAVPGMVAAEVRRVTATNTNPVINRPGAGNIVIGGPG